MSERPFNLAIETASRDGVIALGRGETLLATAVLPTARRHNIELIPAIDRLCAEHQAGPEKIGEIYVSLGPGSFTGLRIALTTAKMLALTQPGLRLIGVPTLDALCRRHPQAMVCLNIKRDTAWCAGPGYRPALRPLSDIQATGLPLVGQTLPNAAQPVFDVQTLWELGRERAGTQVFDDPATLAPLYIREPEAVTLWNARPTRKLSPARPGVANPAPRERSPT